MDNFQKQVKRMLQEKRINPEKILFGIDEKRKETAVYFDSDFLYIESKNQFEKTSRDKAIHTTFLSGAPDGALVLECPAIKLSLHGIHEGRVFDFTQSLDPKSIYKADYNGTQPLQNNVLVDSEHAELIDQLRYQLQTGQISQHDYDSLNPVLPKAGK